MACGPALGRMVARALLQKNPRRGRPRRRWQYPRSARRWPPHRPRIPLPRRSQSTPIAVPARSPKTWFMSPSYSRRTAPVRPHNWPGTGRQERRGGHIVRASWPWPAGGWKRLSSHVIGLEQPAWRGEGGSHSAHRLAGARGRLKWAFQQHKRPETGRQGREGRSYRARHLGAARWRLETAFEPRNRPGTRHQDRGRGPVACAAWPGLVGVWNRRSSHVTGLEHAVRMGRRRALYPARRGRVSSTPPVSRLTQIEEVRVMLHLGETWVSHRRTTHRVVCCRHVLDV